MEGYVKSYSEKNFPLIPLVLPHQEEAYKMVSSLRFGYFIGLFTEKRPDGLEKLNAGLHRSKVIYYDGNITMSEVLYGKEPG